METFSKKKLDPNACAQCGSLYTAPKGDFLYCRDCKALTSDGEIVKTGDLDLHYSLDVQDPENRTLWVDSVYVLFQAQCDIARGLKISPGSSFTNWLKANEAPEGWIDDKDTIRTLAKIAGKILKYAQHIEDPYVIQSVEGLQAALPKADRMILTFKKR
ncbi:MAG TPA: hypothetical protein VK661_08335 [Planctomycetota bacterium]|nr:hypothetical protein [Planctomycetota bacterium]